MADNKLITVLTIGGASYDLTDAKLNAAFNTFKSQVEEDLANRYLKSETYTSSEVDQKIKEASDKIPKFAISIVTALPSVEEADAATIYLVKGAGNDVGDVTGTKNMYVEYILTTNSEGVKSFEELGRQDIDLTGYAKEAWVTGEIGTAKTELEGKITAVETAAATKTALSDAQTTLEGKIATAKSEAITETKDAKKTFTIKNGAEEVTFDPFGTEDKTFTLPTSMKTTGTLTFTGGVTESFDGSVNKTIAIPKFTYEESTSTLIIS